MTKDSRDLNQVAEARTRHFAPYYSSPQKKKKNVQLDPTVEEKALAQLGPVY